MLNKWCGMGRLTADPEMRKTKSGTSVTSFTLAVGRDFARQGEQQTDFIDIVAWGKTAEFTSKWFSKGQLVAVSGRIQVRNWEDKNGQKRRSFEVIAEEAHFAEPKRESMQPCEATPDEFRALDDDSDLPF